MSTLTTVPARTLTSRRPWNTLQILARSRTVLLVLVAVLFATILVATRIHRGAMKLVGNDTAPTIIAAQEIKSGLAEMDADAVEDLLEPGTTKSAALSDDHRIEASKALIDAAKNITFEDERAPIETLQTSIGTYERLLQEARDLQDAAQPEMAVRYYRAAGIVMDGTLLPATDELDKANNDMLEQEYDGKSTGSLIARVLVLLLGLVVLAALVLAQLFLSRRTQRTINPALLAATLLTLGLTIFSFSAMAREQSDLHAAKQDAFDSVRALLRARALAYQARGEEGRALLDPLHAGEYEQEFDRNAASLVALQPPRTVEQFAAELRSGSRVSGFTGLLADELNNITYTGEREAADETAAGFARYLANDSDVRALARSGRQDAALLLDLGEGEDLSGREQSGKLFADFDHALGKTLAINVHEFELARASGFNAVANVEWECGIAALVLLALIFLGFAPRIREYQ